jgi:hypothetical protein
VPAAAGCELAPARRSAVTVTAGADPKLGWRWRGTTTDPMSFGPPTSTHDLTLCIADASGTLLASATAPRGGLCQNGAPCWRPKPTGYDYKDLDRTPDGLEKITLRASPTPGRARIKLKGRGGSLAVGSLPYSAPLRLRLVRDDGGACWEAVYSTPRRNDGTVFKAVSD